MKLTTTHSNVLGKKANDHLSLKALIITFLIFTYLSNPLSAQQIRADFNLKNANIKQLINEIKVKFDYNFVYSDLGLDEVPNKDIQLSKATVNEVLDFFLSNTGFSYEISNQTIVIKKGKVTPSALQALKIRGIVTDKAGDPLPGTSVLIKNTTSGVTTDIDGSFEIKLKDYNPTTLIFSFIGMNSKEVTVRTSNENLRVVLEESVESLKEVVVTGIFTRKREDFTGSVATFSKEDIKSVGNSNIIQSLKTLDPSFALIENNLIGSDPNRLPDIEIRGKSSLLGVRDELAEDPNQPLFILDGFESSLRTIFDMDIDRIASITILKDAASTAIYGSKAANGVVVIETVKPTAGQLQFTYNGSLNASFPDLSSYNMMNSAEKLEFERLAGRYVLSSNSWTAEREILMNKLYNDKLSDVTRGVDTYWLSEPLRTGINQRHSIYAQGGDGGFVFGLGAIYNGITGVMKDSKRDNISGNLDLLYRVSKFQFSNKLQVRTVSSEDPISSFNQYVNANPYYTKYNENGESSKWLEINDLFQASNPMWNDNIGSRHTNKEFNLSNYFMTEYNPVEHLRFRGRFGITYSAGDRDYFLSPNDTRFDTEDILNKGSYVYDNTKSSRIEAELSSTFAKVIDNKHRVNIVAGGNLNLYNILKQGYSVKGFPEGDFTYPSFSKGYPEGGTPTYSQSQSRSISAFINGGYAFDDRFNADLSLRLNGSSVFGSTKQFSGTWSFGLAWNIHNESFIKDKYPGIKMLKIRSSIGNPGNQNFSSYMTLTTYRFNFNSINYFGMSSSISSLGNPNLQWQKTLDKNIGFDITIMNNKLNVVADFFHKTTDPLLVSVNVPSSAGVTQAYTNLGNQTSKGFTATAQYYFVYKPASRITWNVRANIRSQKNTLGGIGNSLNEINKFGQTNNTLKRYYDGADPNDLWAVRSAGIDPATGRELFYKKDGSYTYDYSYDNEVIIGNSYPLLEGILGSSLNYKGFSINFDFRYRTGGYAFNSALFSKVENISAKALNYNQDKRALYERWQKPGDIAKFKDIANSLSTPMSSRFIQKDNSVTLESLRIGYEFYGKRINDYLGVNTLRINAYMNDVFRLSTIKAERGISYPFARTVSLALSLTF